MAFVLIPIPFSSFLVAFDPFRGYSPIRHEDARDQVLKPKMKRMAFDF